MNLRAHEIFQQDLDRQCTLVSRLFAMLLVVQWIGVIIVSLVISPTTWIGEHGRVHEHVWSAIVLGGLLASLPVILALLRPAATSTRHLIAGAQVLFSALLIHLTGGRIETHFHVFGSLAFLAFYRDWRVLMTATVLVALDHWWRGVFWPQSVFGVLVASPWRWVEHAGWVVFEDIMLVASCVVGQRELFHMAEARATLEASRAAVEEQVRVRTAELSQTADALRESEGMLREANQVAQTANRAKSEFLANMSHEIRTPMSAIIGYADLLQDPAQHPEEKLECVRVIRRNGEHLLSLINDILDISKIEAGKMTIEAIDCSPVQLAEDVFSLMQVRALGKGITLRVDHVLPLPQIKTDPLRLRQVLVNLVGNAIKFTEKGEVVLRTSLGPAQGLPPGKANLRIEVIDSGIGMSEESLSRLFQPFSQADASTSRRFGGTGLGLMISQRLIQMLGGEISVTSTMGRGTTATVSLVVEAGEMIRSLDSVSSQGENPSAQSGAIPTPVLTGRILLAEDGPDNQRLLAHHLRRAGVEVVIVENGQHAVDEAIRSLKEGRPFDVILMDMQMPGLDGYGATSLLRHKGWNRPILALTAHAMSSDRERCLQAGCDDYLTKPIEKAVLLSSCARWAAVKRSNMAA